MTSEPSRQFLRLSEPLITFDSTIKRVYFDPINKQVFCVTNGESNCLKVVVRNSRNSGEFSFRLADHGEIFSLKFSPDSRILGIQRSQRSIEFINFDPEAKKIDEIEYSQSVKMKSAKILTFSWFSESEVCFVADKSVEFYTVSSERRTLKLIKCINVQVGWYRFSYDERMLLLFTSESQSSLVPFTFRGGAMERFSKVDIPTRFLVRAATRSQTLLDRDSSLVRIYGKSYYCWLRCPSIAPSTSAMQFLSASPQFAMVSGASSNASEQLFDVFLQEIKVESVGRKMHVLRTASSAKQALNVVDNLVVIHRPTERRSIVFDIRLVDATDDNGVHYHLPITSPFSIPAQPTAAEQLAAASGATIGTNTGNAAAASNLGYRDSWLYFQPDILIDAKVGTVWQFEVLLDGFVQSIPDRIRLVDFLLNRCTSGSKQMICTLVRNVIIEHNSNCLSCLSAIFDKLNVALRRHADYAACLRAAGCALPPDAMQLDNQSGVAMATAAKATDASSLSTSSLSIALPSVTVPNSSLQQFAANATFEYELVHSAQFAYARLIERSVILLDQYDMYVNVFMPLFEEDQPGRSAHSKLLIATLIQYISSLHDANIEVQHFIHNLLATVLAQRGAFNTLQQLIQYSVIADSKQVACLLISLSSQYGPAYQLGIDMLRRLDLTNGDIFDALLVKPSNVPAALRFVHTTQLRLDTVQLQNLFAKLETHNDPLHFYAALGALLAMPHIRDTLAKADWFDGVQQRFARRFPNGGANPFAGLDKRTLQT